MTREKEKYKKKKDKKEKNMKDKMKEYFNETIEEEEEEEYHPSDEEESDGEVHAPKYDIVYTYPVDYADFWNDDATEMRKRPKSFSIKVTLPKVKEIKEITNLEINRKEFILEVAGKYYLDLKMPLPVLSE